MPSVRHEYGDDDEESFDCCCTPAIGEDVDDMLLKSVPPVPGNVPPILADVIVLLAIDVIEKLCDGMFGTIPADIPL